VLGQYVEAKKSLCSDIRAKTFYKGFTFVTSLLGRGKLTFCTKNIHSLPDPKLSKDGKTSIHLHRL